MLQVTWFYQCTPFGEGLATFGSMCICHPQMYFKIMVTSGEKKAQTSHLAAGYLFSSVEPQNIQDR